MEKFTTLRTPVMKHGDDSIMLGRCFSSAGTAALLRIKRIINSPKYPFVLEETLQASLRQVKMKKNFNFQHNNDPKHKSKSVNKQLQKKIWEKF